MSSFLRASFTIAAKDLRSEIRTKEAFNASFAFSLVILVLFSFAFDPSSEELRTISGGLLWLVFSFAGALVLNRSFARELQNDCLDALIASPAPGSDVHSGDGDSPREAYAALRPVELSLSSLKGRLETRNMAICRRIATIPLSARARRPGKLLHVVNRSSDVRLEVLTRLGHSLPGARSPADASAKVVEAKAA